MVSTGLRLAKKNMAFNGGPPREIPRTGAAEARRLQKVHETTLKVPLFVNWRAMPHLNPYAEGTALADRQLVLGSKSHEEDVEGVLGS